jgi:prepilin-type N-terminal cleavage/methylation domain-containing protein
MRRCDPTFRRGFSLLEVLLSLSLSVVLITAIGVAVDQSWQLTAQGQTELQRQQVARAVLRIMERDLRSAMFAPPSQFADDDQDSSSSASTTNSAMGSSGSGSGSSSGGSASSGSASSNTSSTVIGGAQQKAVLASRGIRGDQSLIEIDAARPQKELAFALPVNAAIPSSRTSDFRTVEYLLAGPGQVPDPLGRGGLVRREGDRYAVMTAETAGHDASGDFSVSLLAPEIVGLQFRYFDGTTWYAAWDSSSAGRLPRAVEVLVRFAPPEPKRATWLNAAVNQSTETVRLVIIVPSADPVPEEVVE